MMEGFKEILKTIKDLNEDQFSDFFYGILSPKEIEQIILRYKIIQLLKKNIPQHKIASNLEVGVATVSRGSKMIKEGKFKYVK